MKILGFSYEIRITHSMDDFIRRWINKNKINGHFEGDGISIISDNQQIIIEIYENKYAWYKIGLRIIYSVYRNKKYVCPREVRNIFYSIDGFNREQLKRYFESEQIEIPVMLRINSKEFKIYMFKVENSFCKAYIHYYSYIAGEKSDVELIAIPPNFNVVMGVDCLIGIPYEISASNNIPRFAWRDVIYIYD